MKEREEVKITPHLYPPPRKLKNRGGGKMGPTLYTPGQTCRVLFNIWSPFVDGMLIFMYMYMYVLRNVCHHFNCYCI